MKNKKILIAYDSNTITSLLKNGLEEAGFSVETASDGITALKKTFSFIPDAVIISTELPLLNGYDFSNIIKNNQSLKYITIILSTSEEHYESSFWAGNSMSDGFYVPSSENIPNLCSMLNLKTEMFSKKERPEPRDIDEKEIITLLTQTFNSELFSLYTIRTVFFAGNYMWETEQVLEHMAKTLSAIFNYDAMGIIVNENPLIEYYDHTDSISQADFDDFRKICQSDFRTRNPNRKDYDWKNSIFLENSIEQFSDTKEKLKNYDLFPMDSSKKFPMTIHTASCGSGTINSRTRSRIDFLAEVYAPIIDKTVSFRKTKFAEQKMKAAFSRFLPVKVVDEIIAGDEISTTNIGEERKVAILMADIRNFTTITEKNKPEDIISFLNLHFTKMGNIIKKYGGTVDKFIGDCIMAVFGAPESYKYNADRAARAALEMMAEIEKTDTSMLRIPEGMKFSVGIGIHYGNPIAGTIGSDHKKEYTVIGDDVNIASRIENLTKVYKTKILVTGAVKEDIEAAESEGTYNDSPESEKKLFLRKLDTVRVKGKSVPVEVYELRPERNCYSNDFLENYSKALFQYEIGNFSGAQEYLRNALLLKEDDTATQVLLQRCKNFTQNKPENWDGAITLNQK